MRSVPISLPAAGEKRTRLCVLFSSLIGHILDRKYHDVHASGNVERVGAAGIVVDDGGVDLWSERDEERHGAGNLTNVPGHGEPAARCGQSLQLGLESLGSLDSRISALHEAVQGSR